MAGIIAGLGTIAGIGIGAGLMLRRTSHKSLTDDTKETERLKSYFNLLYSWLMLKQEKRSLEEYFVDHKIKTIAIYGMGSIGSCLYNELKNSEIEVKYAIDRNASSVYENIEILNIDNKIFPSVDAVVVTPVHVFSEINSTLSSMFDCPIISLENIMYEVL